MPRIRTIKPEHVNDKQLTTISMQAHLFWILSWCFSDDDGVIENDPILLKSQIFPRRSDVRVEQIEQWIGQLVKARFMVPFTYDNVGYLIHRTFRTHQKIDRKQPSKISAEVIRRTLDECSSNDQPCIVEESNSKGEESKPKPAPDSVEIIFPFETENFKSIWQQWKNYKKTEHRFHFKSPQSEQSSLKGLAETAKGNEETAIAIIQQSMANGWKGFFELKTNNYAKQSTSNDKQPTGASVSTGSILEKIAGMPG